jgi:hypothetical protein
LTGITVINAGYGTNPPITIQDALDQVIVDYGLALDNEFDIIINPGVYNSNGSTSDMGSYVNGGLQLNVGTYNDPLNINLRGYNIVNFDNPSSSTNTIITGNNANNRTLLIMNQGTGSGQIIVTVNIQNIVFQDAWHGIETLDASVVGETGITNLVVSNCLVQNCNNYNVVSSLTSKQGAGIRHIGPADITNVVVKNCNYDPLQNIIFETSGTDGNFTKGGGIYLENNTPYGAKISGCTIFNNRAMQGGGVFLTGQGPIEFSGNRIYNNTRLAKNNYSSIIMNGQAEGIYALNCRNLSINKNVIFSNNQNPDLMGWGDVPSALFAENCGIITNTTYPISSYPTKLYISNNNILDNYAQYDYHGIAVKYRSDITNGQTTSFVIENNIVYNNGLLDGCGIVTEALNNNTTNPQENPYLCGFIKIRNNDSFGNGQNPQHQYEYCVTHSAFSDNISEYPNLNYITERPNWTAYGRSPCIMAGYSEFSELHYDKPDIGAFQYLETEHEYFTYKFPPFNIRNGIKWMSFPTVDRIWNVPDDQKMLTNLLNPVMQNHDIIRITRKLIDDYQMSYYFLNNNWYGIDHIVTPMQGYKIQSSQYLLTEASLGIRGNKTANETDIQIRALLNDQPNENWLGYFHDKTVAALDAFQGILSNIYYLQTQDWTICRTKPNPNAPWIIPLINGNAPTLSYGEMVIVKCFGNATFQWNNSAPESVKIDKPATEHYSYEEKTDYIPIYIEIIGANLPKEAAIFINDVCKGAAVVNDNLVEVPAYILDDLEGGAEIEIRMYFEGRSGEIIPRYNTWNDQLDMFENKTLFIKDKKDYFMISIGGDNTSEIPQMSISLSNHPNPFCSGTLIKYYVPDDAVISLDIFNTKGQKVTSVFSGKKNKGLYDFKWSGYDDRGKSLSNGVYFAVLKCQGKQVCRKMVLMK